MKPKIAYFFGAGTSVYGGMQTTDKMLQFLDDNIKGFKEFNDEIKGITDIEQFAGFVENLTTNPVVHLFLNKNNEFKKSVEDMKNWKIETLVIVHKCLLKLSVSDATIDSYNTMLKELQSLNPDEKLRIITTNYDTILDKSLGEGKQWNDGFQEGGTWANLWNDDLPTLVKLHGSIHWQNVTSNKDKKDGRIHIQKGEVAQNVDSMVIIRLTTNEKRYDDVPFDGLFAKFKEILDDVDLLVVVGYAFRDKQIRNAILKHVNENKLHVLVISPSAGNDIDKMLKIQYCTIYQDGTDMRCDDDLTNLSVYCNPIEFNSKTMPEIIKTVKWLKSIK